MQPNHVKRLSDVANVIPISEMLTDANNAEEIFWVAMDLIWVEIGGEWSDRDAME